MIQSLHEVYKSFSDALESYKKIDLYLLLTLLLLILHASEALLIKVPITFLSIIGFVFPFVRRNENFWFILSCILILGNLPDWYIIDNHKYLFIYWCLSLFFALKADNPQKTLAISARLLIGLVFLFSTFWKITSIDFRDGTFFHYTLLIDQRFERATVFFGISESINEFNQVGLDALTSYDSVLNQVELRSTDGVYFLANFLTWWTLLIEGTITIAFLLWSDNFFTRARNYILLIFITTTYSIATVIGFGWILAIMGASQAEQNKKHLILLYLMTIILLQIYRLPWLFIG